MCISVPSKLSKNLISIQDHLVEIFSVTLNCDLSLFILEYMYIFM